MSDKVALLEELRPPTIIHKEGSPITTQKTSKYVIARNQIVCKDERTMSSEKQWDMRHHVSPSHFNGQNHTYYKQYFDKGFRIKDNILMRPKRMLDPYEMNEVKGVRFPEYSKIIKDRDVYGELGWVPNFNVKLSKNNDKMHQTYKEFFDQPKNYHVIYNNSNMVTSDYYRNNAPSNSVAKTKNRSQSSKAYKSPTSTIRSPGGGQEAQSPSASPLATPFYLTMDQSNKYKVDHRVEKSIDFTNMIPFLRDKDEAIPRAVHRRMRSLTTKFTDTANSPIKPSTPMRSSQGMHDFTTTNRLRRKETNWDSYVKPISFFNERQQSNIPVSSMADANQPQQKSFNDYSPMQSMALNRYNFDYTSPQAIQPEQPREFTPSYGMSNKIPNEIPLNQTPSSSMSNWSQNPAPQIPYNDQRYVKSHSFTTSEPLRSQQPQFMQMNQNITNQQPNNFALMQQLINQNQLQNNDHMMPNQSNLQQQLLQSQLQFQLLNLLQQQNSTPQAQMVPPQTDQSRNKFGGMVPNQMQLPLQNSQHSMSQLQLQQQQQQQQQLQNPLLIQALLQTGTMTPQPLQKQPSHQSSMMSESYVNTPLESSRYTNNSNNETIPYNFSQGLQQQQQQLGSNYTQLHDNLNQYKKLISYLENIDTTKARSNQQQQQQQQHQQQPNIYQSQSQFIPMQPMSIPQTQRHEHSSYEQTPSSFQDNLHKSSISNDSRNASQSAQSMMLWPSQAQEVQKQDIITWPSSQLPDERLDKSTQQQNRQQTHGYLFDKQMENVPAHDYHNEGRVQNISVTKINNFIDCKEKQNDGNLSQQQISEDEISKLSGDHTKESYTDMNSQHHTQQMQMMMNCELNKSIHINDTVSLHNQSQISESRSQRVLRTKMSPPSPREDNDGVSSRIMRSNEHTFIQEDQMQSCRDEKPIINNQLTFEQLLETKLQEHGAGEQSLVSTQKPKKEFLRKNSTMRTQNSQERAKSKQKYKYYSDNFNGDTNNTNTNSLNIQEVQAGPNTRKIPTKSSHHQTSPSLPKKQQQQIESSSNTKKYQTSQKSTQRQPTQQSNKSPHNRPQSSQQISGNSSAQKSTSANNRSRQVPQISNLNSLQHSKTVTSIAKKEESDPILTDRNSIVEFEMLEQECIAKCQQSETSMSSIQQEKEHQEQQQQQQMEMVEKPKIQKSQQVNKENIKENKEQSKKFESKLKELDNEIVKFKQENKRVNEMQVECEQQLKRLTSQIEEFEERKEKDIEDIVQWKEEEMEEIRVIRQKMQQEREEIETQKQQSALKRSNSHKQEEELTRKENERLIKFIQELKSENNELKDRIDELTDKEYKCAGTQTQNVQQPQPSPVKEQISEQPQNKQQDTMGIHDDVIEEEVDNESKGSSIQNNNNEEEQDEEEEEEEEKRIATEEQVNETEEFEEDEYDLKFPSEYHGKAAKQVKMTEEVIGHDGKIQRIFENGKKEVVFTNGVKREVWPDGYSIVYFNNSDIKQTFTDGKIVYYFSDAKTTQTTFANGLQVFKFANSQIEKHFIDGTKEISFPDGTIKCLFPDGEEESIFPDGTIQKIEKSGVKIIEFPNGQRDVIYPDGIKLREFQDGTVKKIYPDGKTEILPAKKKTMIGKGGAQDSKQNNKKYLK